MYTRSRTWPITRHTSPSDPDSDGKTTLPMYTLVSYLANPERELQFLRSVAEVVILILLPPDYSRCVPVRQLLREILACHGQSACWGPAVFWDDKVGVS